MPYLWTNFGCKIDETAKIWNFIKNDHYIWIHRVLIVVFREKFIEIAVIFKELFWFKNLCENAKFLIFSEKIEA